MTIEEYFNRCKAADFHYMYSDDAKVYRERKESLQKLWEDSNGNPQFAAVYDAWYDFNHCECPTETPKLEDYIND